MDNRLMDGTKLLWHMDRVNDLEMGERVAPVHIDMGIAKFCNVDCVFCYGVFQNMSKQYIKREALIQAMKDAGEIGVRSIGIIGDGEPTCNPHFYEALYAGKQAGVSLATSTNGVLLTTEERRTAVLANTEWMRFCFSAGTRKGYKQIHRTDKFDTVVRNIEAMVLERDQNYQTDIGLQAVFVPNLMQREIVEEAKLAVDLGVDYLVVKQCSLPDKNAAVAQVQFDPKIYDSPEVIGALKEAEALSTSRTKIIVKWNTIKQKGMKPYVGCRSIPLISEISGNGDWYPCGYMFGGKPEFEEYKFGNLHEKSLKEIFESERYWSIISKMRQFDVQHGCFGSCRQDACNKFMYDFEQKPRGLNFI